MMSVYVTPDAQGLVVARIDCDDCVKKMTDAWETVQATDGVVVYLDPEPSRVWTRWQWHPDELHGKFLLQREILTPEYFSTTLRGLGLARVH